MPAGRPAALSKERVSQAKEIIDKDPRVVYIRTEEQLIDEINYQLRNNKKGHMIMEYRTYQKYKKEMYEWETSVDSVSKELLEEFWRVIKKAMRDQSIWLVSKMEQEEKAWQRYAWLIERKLWPERNKVNKNEHSWPDGSDLFKGITITDATKDE